jgi:hypothetical protein
MKYFILLFLFILFFSFLLSLSLKLINTLNRVLQYIILIFNENAFIWKTFTDFSHLYFAIITLEYEQEKFQGMECCSDYLFKGLNFDFIAFKNDT